MPSGVNVFADGAQVGAGLASQGHRRRLAARHHRRWKSRVGGAAQKEKLRQIVRVLAGKGHFLRAGADIKAGQRIHRQRLAVNVRHARAARVDRAQFALFQEERPAGFVMVGQLHRLARGHNPPDDQPVQVGEHAVDLARRVEAGARERCRAILRWSSARLPAGAAFGESCSESWLAILSSRRRVFKS